MVWGFNRGDLDAARARRSRISVRDPFLAEPLPPSQRTEVELDQLHAFFKNPVAYFISHRLEAHLPVSEEEPSVLLPVELSGLDRWRVASRLLEARLAGIDTDRWCAVERQRSTLPPGSLGQRTVEACADEVEAVAAVAASIGVGNGPPDPFEIEVKLPSGIRILGTVPLSLPAPHRGPARISYSTLKPEHRVHAWLDLMALAATDPRHRWRSVAVGRPNSSGGTPRCSTSASPEAEPTGGAWRNGHWRWRSTAIAAASANRSPFLPTSPTPSTPTGPGPPTGRTTTPFPTATIPPWSWPSGVWGSTKFWPSLHDLTIRATGGPDPPVRPPSVRHHRGDHSVLARFHRSRCPEPGHRGVMSSDTGAPFAVVDPLPRGGLAIEASAGTGKTTALADLATRFLAESGVATSELLIVTFTRAATNELRARVRNRLIEVADRLEDGDPPATATGPGEVDPFDDPVVGLLAARDKAVHARRLRAAAVEFDAATITTIHGFAVQVRSALGEAAGIDPEVTLVDEGDQIVLQTCADVLAEASASERPAADLPTLSELGAATMRAASRPDMVLEPHSVDQRATPAQLALRQLVEQSVLRLDGRRRRQGTASFDSVLVDLCGALTGPGSEAAVASLRRRYRVALIDEFQDTDPVQWRIFERLFGEPNAGTTLVVVGDPKQAIYGFRGGDIDTYINAVKDRDLLEHRSMHANWRSDVAVLAALDVLFAGATFGDQSIRYLPVTAARPAQHRRLRDGSGASLPALSLRLAIDPGIRRTRTASQVVVAAGARAIEEDLVARVRDLLDHATIPSAGEDGPPRPVRPQDIAVLVNRNDECTAFQSALADQGVPAVVAQGETCFDPRPPNRCGGCCTPWVGRPTPVGPAPTPCRGSAVGAQSSSTRRSMPIWPLCKRTSAPGPSSWPPTRWPRCWRGCGRPAVWPARSCPVRTAIAT